MKSLIVITESFRRAGLNTMYRATLALAVASQRGITYDVLSKLMGTSRESVRIGVRELEKRNFVYTEKTKHARGYFRTKVHPTPYLRDIVRNMKFDFEEITKTLTTK